MSFENEEHDRLQFEHLAGGNVIRYPPIYASSGEYLLMLSEQVINVYSTATGQIVRKLEGATSPLVDFEFDWNYDDLLVACSRSGEILTWLWKTGELKSCVRKDLQNSVVTNFKLLNIYGKSELSNAFMCLKNVGRSASYCLVDRVTGYVISIPLDFKLGNVIPLVAVDNKNFPNLVIAQGCYIFFINYKYWTWRRLVNAHKVPVTALQKHPTEECFATGDEMGKIFLWRQFMTTDGVVTCLYHWHHTKVTSICFTMSGSNFFSSGEESVMVKWNVDNPKYRQFLPRMASKIKHIVVSPDNAQIAVCTVDNGVQFVGAEHSILSNLQEFTYIPDDNTECSKFPVGMRLNPRTNTLVLNGRTGSLQFYNTYTRNLLYNLNIVNQNLLSHESDRVLYDIRVTKAAFNIDWLATGEVFNDQQHLPELRLKFWKYEEESKRYTLNTNIELPHEGGFKAIEFSNDYQVENLLCATVGEDNIIKMWCLEDSDNIYKEGKTWYCIAQTSYRNLPIQSISFSQDGSLLGAGFGNTLCIYKSENLKLKAALTGANGMDGCVAKTQIRIPSKNVNGAKAELKEKRDRLLKLFTNLLDMNEETLIKELKKSVAEKYDSETCQLKHVEKLSDAEKTALYSKILKTHELNLFQKVMIYQKLGISCKVHPQIEARMIKYINNSARPFRKQRSSARLHSQLHRLNVSERFKAKYRLEQYVKRQRTFDEKITKNLVSLMNCLNLEKYYKTENYTQTNDKNVVIETSYVHPRILNASDAVPPKPTLAEISHVQFAAGEYGHLVVVCTERRILIWNLLTLRLQSVLKLSVKHLTFDRQTNLMAVVTNDNELHVFQPNVPLPIYQRRNVPELHGMAWIPRRHPKQRSINLDWQAQSTLYFLTQTQAVIYLSSPTEKQPDVPPAVGFNNAASESMRYSTFGTFAVKSVTEKQTLKRQTGRLVLGNSDKTAVKALIDMATHTMPPLSLMCEDFLKSMVDSISSTNAGNANSDDATSSRLNGDMNGFASHSDNDEDNKDDDNDDDDDRDPDGDMKMTNGTSSSSTSSSSTSKKNAMKIRKDLMRKIDELKRRQKTLGISVSEQQYDPANENDAVEAKLRYIATQDIEIDF